MPELPYHFRRRYPIIPLSIPYPSSLFNSSRIETSTPLSTLTILDVGTCVGSKPAGGTGNHEGMTIVMLVNCIRLISYSLGPGRSILGLPLFSTFAVSRNLSHGPSPSPVQRIICVLPVTSQG